MPRLGCGAVSGIERWSPSRHLEVALQRLYAEVGRAPPSLILATSDPSEFVRLAQATGRLSRPIEAGLLVVAALVCVGLATAMVWSDDPRTLKAAPVAASISGLFTLVVAFGSDIGREPTPGHARADVLALLLLIAAAALLTGAVGGPLWLANATFATLAGVAALLRATVLANGGVPGRLGLAWSRASTNGLGSASINAAMRREIYHALDHQAPTVSLPGPGMADDPDRWRHVEELGRRRVGAAWRDLFPPLGREVPGARHRFLIGRSVQGGAASPLAEAATELDAASDICVFFERAAVLLLPGARLQPSPAATDAPGLRWRRQPYAAVLAMLQASVVWHCLIAIAPSRLLADRLLARLIAADPDPALRLAAIERMGGERFCPG